MVSETNRVWIELVHPREADGVHSPEEYEAFTTKQCALANNMLTRLADPAHLPLQAGFFFSAHRNCYCFGGHMGYEELPDRGKWFNLDYFGRDLPASTGS